MDTDNKKCSHELTYGEERYGRYKAFTVNLFSAAKAKTQHGF